MTNRKTYNLQTTSLIKKRFLISDMTNNCKYKTTTGYLNINLRIEQFLHHHLPDTPRLFDFLLQTKTTNKGIESFLAMKSTEGIQSATDHKTFSIKTKRTPNNDMLEALVRVKLFNYYLTYYCAAFARVTAAIFLLNAFTASIQVVVNTINTPNNIGAIPISSAFVPVIPPTIANNVD